MNITEAEWEVMRVLWTKENTSSREIIDALKIAYSWKEGTIKTLIKRLEDKKIISRNNEFPCKYIYNISFIDAVNIKISNILNKVCNKNIGTILNQIILNNDLSENDIEILIESLKNKEKIKEVTCNCIKHQCKCGKDCYGKKI